MYRDRSGPCRAVDDKLDELHNRSTDLRRERAKNMRRRRRGPSFFSTTISRRRRAFASRSPIIVIAVARAPACLRR